MNRNNNDYTCIASCYSYRDDSYIRKYYVPCLRNYYKTSIEDQYHTVANFMVAPELYECINLYEFPIHARVKESFKFEVKSCIQLIM